MDVGDYVYNPRVSLAAPVGPISKNKICKGVMSPPYTIFRFNNYNNDYYEQFFKSTKWYGYLRIVSNNGVRHDRMNITNDEFMRMPVPEPDEREQQKIADCLGSIDELITAHTLKFDTLKIYKKGLMQQLFPAEGAIVPVLRFPVFRGKNNWKSKKLADYLNYLQPTNYLVSSTTYNNEYDIPVLTAGKTFILGYTNETTGIFDKNLPVIIFDDFTTASKYVDFPFKVKSSAMKILLVKKGMDIKFVYESMQMIKYEVGAHERHWISIFSKIKILSPDQKEQQKIANFLTSLDDLIYSQKNKTEYLKVHKKALMQRLFPKID